MSGKNRSNVLLVEILIAVLFFMLSAVILVRVFAAARNLSVRSGVETQALAEAQNVADLMLAAEDVETTYTLYIEGGAAPAGNGALWEGVVRAYYRQQGEDGIRSDAELFALPCVRYREAEA